MALGYEGYASLKVDGTETVVLCTGASVPKGRNRLDSNSAYGGQLDTPVDEIAIGYPHQYDWPTWDGSIDYELTPGFFDDQINPWIFERQKSAVVKVITRSNSLQQFDNCYWNSINISANESASVAGSIGFVAIQRDAYTQGGGYIDNKIGELDCTYLQTSGDIPALNPDDENFNPIPWWNTMVAINGQQYEFINWSLSYSQEVTKFFGCEANPDPIAPLFLAVGPMSIEFQGAFMFLSSGPNWNPPEYAAGLDIFLAVNDSGPNPRIKLRQLDLESVNDDLPDGNSTVPIAVAYSAYELVA